MVWQVALSGQVHRACIHCHRDFGRHEEADPALAAKQAAQSLAGHAATCPIPVRTVSGVDTTRIDSAHSVTDEDERRRAQRARFAGRR